MLDLQVVIWVGKNLLKASLENAWYLIQIGCEGFANHMYGGHHDSWLPQLYRVTHMQGGLVDVVLQPSEGGGGVWKRE